MAFHPNLYLIKHGQPDRTNSNIPLQKLKELLLYTPEEEISDAGLEERECSGEK